MKLLLVEDDKEAAEYLVKGLKEQGHAVDHADQGKDGLFMAMSETYDAMIIWSSHIHLVSCWRAWMPLRAAKVVMAQL